jgi:hypothetical protein
MEGGIDPKLLYLLDFRWIFAQSKRSAAPVQIAEGNGALGYMNYKIKIRLPLPAAYPDQRTGPHAAAPVPFRHDSRSHNDPLLGLELSPQIFVIVRNLPPTIPLKVAPVGC